jgi:hypothetical protein
MAAIVQTRRIHSVPQRPALRLVPAGGGRPVDVPVDAPLSLGLGASHLVVAVVAMVIVLFGALAIGNGALASLAPAPSAPAASNAATGDAASTSATSMVTVEPGDTLWSIARRLQPTGDVRSLVDQLQALNGSAPLQSGDQVRIPA